MKYLFLDVETTGISSYEHSITQIAAIIEINHTIVDKLIIDVAPITGSKIDPEALAITGKTKEEIEAYPSASQQLETLTNFLQKHIDQYSKKDKFFFVAYNAPFDFDFIRQFFNRLGNKFFGSYFWNPAIDVMTLAMEFLKNQRENMPNFKLSTVASFMGINVESSKLHDAYYDILLTYEIYKKIEFQFSSENKENTNSFNNTITIKQEPETYKDTLF
jgi:DNA polymerase-3 subunit epsilon